MTMPLAWRRMRKPYTGAEIQEQEINVVPPAVRGHAILYFFYCLLLTM